MARSSTPSTTRSTTTSEAATHVNKPKFQVRDLDDHAPLADAKSRLAALSERLAGVNARIEQIDSAYRDRAKALDAAATQLAADPAATMRSDVDRVELERLHNERAALTRALEITRGEITKRTAEASRLFVVETHPALAEALTRVRNGIEEAAAGARAFTALRDELERGAYVNLLPVPAIVLQLQAVQLGRADFSGFNSAGQFISRRAPRQSDGWIGEIDKLVARLTEAE